MRKLLMFLVTIALLAQTARVAPITVTAATGSARIITASTNGMGTRVYHISLAWNTSADIYFLYGTGTACATGSTSLTGAYVAQTSLTLDFDNHPFRVPPGNDFCVNFSTTVTAGGVATYDQQQ